MLRFRRSGFVLAVSLLFWGAHTSALIERLYTLKEVLDTAKVIVEGTIESVDFDESRLIIKVETTVKGKCIFKRIKVNASAGQAWHPKAFMKHIKEGNPVILFYDVDQNKLPCLGYTDGLWFQLYADADNNPERIWFNLTHMELLMNRTYSGKTEDLIQVVKDVIAGKAEPPEPDPKLKQLTRDDLLGVDRPVIAAGPNPHPVIDDVDRAEASKEWKAEPWANPAKAAIVDWDASHGSVLRIDAIDAERHKFIPEYARAGGAQEKIFVIRFLNQDFSHASRLLFEAFNMSEKPVKVAIGITTKDYEFFETPMMTLPPKQWNYEMAVDLKATNFKSAASKWEHKTALLDRDRVSKVTILVYDCPPPGTVLIDRMRLDNGSLFIRSIPLPRAAGGAGGVSWCDFDGDGKPDAMVCAVPGDKMFENKGTLETLGHLLSADGNRLFQNRGGDFVDVTTVSGLKGGSHSAVWADYNGDGKPDLVYSNPIKLWTNDNGKFVDDTKLLGTLPPGSAVSLGWLDASGSGRADLIIASSEKGLCLLSNPRGDANGFKDSTAEFGLQKFASLGAPEYLALGDFNSDGFTDIFYNRDRGLLVRNDEGKGFKLVSNTRVEYQTIANAGVAFGDYDNDGNFDLFVPQSGKCCLFHNNNDGTFTNVIDQAGALATLPPNARCAAWGDVNMDGRLDLVVGFADAPAMYFLNLGKGKFAEAVSLEAFKCAIGATGMAFADFDGDGDLDLLVSGKDSAGILVNGCRRSNQYIGIRIRIPVKEAPGAWVRLYDSADHPLGIRQVGLVSGIGSQEGREAHFAVAPGDYKASVILTNGKVQQKNLTVGKTGWLWDVGKTSLLWDLGAADSPQKTEAPEKEPAK